MALIECPECKKEISDSAASCPHCGYQLKKPPPPPRNARSITKAINAIANRVRVVICRFDNVTLRRPKISLLKLSNISFYLFTAIDPFGVVCQMR